MAAERADVPAEIEEYLIGLYVRAGQIGGAIGGVAAGSIVGPAAAAGALRGGGRGGAMGAARLPTKVEERTGDAPGTANQIAARLVAAFPRATRLPSSEHVRLAVPVGVTGLQQIVVDLEFRAAEDQADSGRVPVRLRGFGKEGLLSRKPTRKVTDQAWSAISTGGLTSAPAVIRREVIPPTVATGAGGRHGENEDEVMARAFGDLGIAVKGQTVVAEQVLIVETPLSVAAERVHAVLAATTHPLLAGQRGISDGRDEVRWIAGRGGVGDELNPALITVTLMSKGRGNSAIPTYVLTAIKIRAAARGEGTALWQSAAGRAADEVGSILMGLLDPYEVIETYENPDDIAAVMTETKWEPLPGWYTVRDPASCASYAEMAQLRGELYANHEAYQFGRITRDQWIARNRELVTEARPHGWDLPFGL